MPRKFRTVNSTAGFMGAVNQINQNFALLDNETSNALIVIKSGTYTFPAYPGIAAATSVDQTISFEHDYRAGVPAILVFANVSTAEVAGFPSSAWMAISGSLSFAQFGSAINNALFACVDGTSLYITRTIFNGSGSASQNADAVDISYYITRTEVITTS